MSAFLMVVPVGWQEVNNATSFVERHTEAQLIDFLNYNNIGGFDGLLGDEGYVPVDKTTEEVTMFRDGAEFRIWFKLKPLY